MAKTLKPLTITDLKILRGQVYATLTVGSAGTSTVNLSVKLATTHKGLQEALEPLYELVKAAADSQLATGLIDQATSDARLQARQDVAGQVLKMIQRGTMPNELERALTPMARPVR
jgi:hypothetical protein